MIILFTLILVNKFVEDHSDISKYIFLLFCYTLICEWRYFTLLSEAIILRINELLKEKNLTVYKLSYRADISNSIISNCKRGKVKEPSISSIIHICEGFGIELKDFFDSPYFKDV